MSGLFGSWRKRAFQIALGVSVLSGSAALAQTTASSAGSVPPCQTNVGLEGYLFAGGYLGVIYSPLPFQNVRSKGLG